MTSELRAVRRNRRVVAATARGLERGVAAVRRPVARFLDRTQGKLRRIDASMAPTSDTLDEDEWFFDETYRFAPYKITAERQAFFDSVMQRRVDA